MSAELPQGLPDRSERCRGTRWLIDPKSHPSLATMQCPGCEDCTEATAPAEDAPRDICFDGKCPVKVTHYVGEAPGCQPPAPESPAPTPDIAAAIATIESSRKTHVDWGAYFEAHPEEEAKHAKTVHSAAEQREIVAAYDNVLACLRKQDEAERRAAGAAAQANSDKTALTLAQRVHGDLERSYRAKLTAAEAERDRLRERLEATGVLAEILTEQQHGRQKYGGHPDNTALDDSHTEDEWASYIADHNERARITTPMERRQHLVKVAGLALSAIDKAKGGES